MYREIIQKNKVNFEKTLSFFQEEIGKIRTGRASSALVENLPVDYYGNKTPLKQIASITVPEARTIAISPWDRDSLVNIEKAVRDSRLNLNPINDGQIIRINLPELNEERRKELVKLLNQKTEEARVGIRKIREDAWSEIQKMEKEGAIGEDEKFQGKDKLQEIVDEYNSEIEEIRKKKEEEIMKV